jgi:Ca2+-binding RTX toxin-like protein
LIGNKLNNQIEGKLGDDLLNGNKGIDTLIGGDGNDTYIVDTTTDSIVEGSGGESGNHDLIQSSVTFSMALVNHVEDLTLLGKSKINATGNTLNNILTGNTSTNQLNGGDGNDLLNGGLGNDTLIGGDGEDTFIFNTKLNKSSNVDTITDFSHTDDVIQLALSLFTNIKGSDNLFNASDLLVSSWTAKQKVNATSDAHLIFNTTNQGLYYDADGSGKELAIHFATLTGLSSIDASDFQII